LTTIAFRLSIAAASSKDGWGISSAAGEAVVDATDDPTADPEVWLATDPALRDAKGDALPLDALSLLLALRESVSKCGVKVSAPFSGAKGDFCLDFPAGSFVPDDDLLGGPPKDAGLREISSVLSGKTEVFRVNFG